MQTPSVSVIIVNYNSGDHLSRCLQCLEKQTISNFETLVFDCNSSDGSFRAAESERRNLNVQFEPLKKNLGFAAACNLGANFARAPLIAMLNPDAFPATDWLERLLNASMRFPGIAAFGSTQIKANTKTMLDGAGDSYFALGLPWRGGHGRHLKPLSCVYETFSVCAAAALYRRDLFLTLGGFDERYFCYLEDVDLGFRLRLSGARSMQVPDAVAHHVGGASSTDNPNFAAYHGTRNAIWTFVKNMPAPLLIMLWPGHFALLIVVLIHAISRRRVSAVFRGIVDGFRGIPNMVKSRRSVHARRVLASFAVARLLVWSPLALLRRAVVPIRVATKLSEEERHN